MKGFVIINSIKGYRLVKDMKSEKYKIILKYVIYKYRS